MQSGPARPFFNKSVMHPFDFAFEHAKPDFWLLLRVSSGSVWVCWLIWSIWFVWFDYMVQYARGVQSGLTRHFGPRSQRSEVRKIEDQIHALIHSTNHRYIEAPVFPESYVRP